MDDQCPLTVLRRHPSHDITAVDNLAMTSKRGFRGYISPDFDGNILENNGASLPLLVTSLESAMLTIIDQHRHNTP